MKHWLRRKIFNKLTLVFILLLALGGATYILGWSTLLTVEKVRVLGAPTRSDQIVIAGEIPMGEKLARLNKQSISTSLSRFSWLDHSSIQTDWLHGVVTIRLWLRKAVAIIGGNLVDKSGVLFNRPGVELSSLPHIIAASKETRLTAVTLLARIPLSLRTKVRTVSVPGLRSITLTVEAVKVNSIRTINIFWGDVSNTDLKVLVYHSLLALPENSRVTQMDLSAPHAPIVK